MPKQGRRRTRKKKQRYPSKIRNSVWGVRLRDDHDKVKRLFEFCNEVGDYKDGYIDDEVIRTWLRGAHELTIINYENDDGSAYFDKAYIAYETLKKEIDKTENKKY